MLEDTLNEGIEVVVDDDAAVTFPGLSRRYSMLEYMRGVVARPCDLHNGESEVGSSLMWPGWMSDADVSFGVFRAVAEEWFGYRIRPDGTLDTKPHPNKPTGNVGRIPGQRRANHGQRLHPRHRGLPRARSR